MTGDQFCDLARSMPEAVQSAHFDVTDFRFGKRIFATWRAKDARAVLRLSPEEQALFLDTHSEAFRPVTGSWGAKGWTQILLDVADDDVVRHAVRLAHRGVGG